MKYRKIPNIIPGLIEVRKHFLVDLHLGGGELIYRAYIWKGFGLTSELCKPKIQHSVPNPRD